MTAWSFSPDDLAKVTEIEPDLIILDLMLGPTELQGWALLQKLRMSPPTEEIPVVVCTAATNWVLEQEGWLAANATKVVLKPFKVRHLEHAIRQALDLPEVMASGELVEGEMAEQGGGPPAPANRETAARKAHQLRHVPWRRPAKACEGDAMDRRRSNSGAAARCGTGRRLP
jgi:CheY-like chemotaxis protein